MKIGCHVSIAGGIVKAPQNAQALAGECFQMFSRSPRGGKYTPPNQTTAEEFLSECEKYGYRAGQDYVIHTPYFINLASSTRRIYHGSISVLRQELEVASLIKCPYVITHIGSAKDLPEKKVKEKVSKGLWEIHKNYHGSAMLVLEIAAGSGQIIGDDFEEIGYFLKEAKKKKIKLGFCFDTCHAFAAGYDLRTPQKVKAVFRQMDEKIGLENLKAIHFNDSLTDFDSHKDRHEHIGKGKIGEEGLKTVVKVAKKLALNLYLETKHDRIEEDLNLTKKFRDNSK